MFSLCSYIVAGYLKSNKDFHIDFCLSFHGMKGKYFLAVSNKPFDNSTFDHKVDKYCMIYLKKDESVVFVKDKIIKPEDRNQEEFPRLIKYAAGVVQEKDYEVVYGDIRNSNMGLKIKWTKQNNEISGNLIFCVVCPKIQE